MNRCATQKQKLVFLQVFSIRGVLWSIVGRNIIVDG
jgi:hypothetical protein